MNIDVKFGDALKLLISALDISISRLSKAINVDTSLVNRWVNNKRVPSYNTPYIDDITEYLSRNIQNSHQVQYIKDIVGKYIQVDSSQQLYENMHEVIQLFLKEAQGYSLEIRKKEKSALVPVSSGMKPEKASNKSEKIGFCFLSSEDQIIPGLKNIIRHCTTLMKEAVYQKKKEGNNEIYITFYTDILSKDISPKDFNEWINSIYEAIVNGWSVTFLVHLDHNWKRTSWLINCFKPLIKTGKLHINYIKNYDSGTYGNEKIVISGVGAVSIYTTGGNASDYYAFSFRNTEAVDILKRSITSILSTASEKLTNYYDAEKKRYYSLHLMEIEENLGTRYLYRSYFSMLTLPENTFMKLLSRAGLSQEELLFELKSYRSRKESFLKNLRTEEYKDIYWYESIEKLIRERKFYLHSKSDIYVVDMEAEDILEHLNYIKKLLEQNENYHIGFIHEKISSMNLEYYYYVKERQAVFIGCFETLNNNAKSRIIITEPTSVKAMINYFSNVWKHISPVNKNKKDIIEWLNKHIHMVKSEVFDYRTEYVIS